MSKVHQTPQELVDEVTTLKERIAQLEASEAKRKRAELTLRAAAEEWEQSFNALTDDVIILDKSGIVLWANKATRDRFESTHGNLLGLDYRLPITGPFNPMFDLPGILSCKEHSPLPSKFLYKNSTDGFQSPATHSMTLRENSGARYPLLKILPIDVGWKKPFAISPRGLRLPEAQLSFDH